MEKIKKNILASVLVALFLTSTITILAENKVDLTATVKGAPVAHAGGFYYGYTGRAIKFDGTDSTDADGWIVSYVWDFGDGTIGTGSGPSHAYPSATTYTVSLTVTDNDGLVDSDVTTAKISRYSRPSPGPSPPPKNKKPVADAGLNQTVYAEAIVFFNGTGSYDPDGQIVNWYWGFGDNITASGEIVTHIYSEPGKYTVILLVVDDDDAENIDTCIVTVREIPVPPPPPPPPPPLPPILSDLTITPEEIELGENVTIGLKIENIDSQSIDYIVTMRIGELTLLVDVELGAYEFTTVSRTITPNAVGGYDVIVDGMTGSFTVKPVPIPPKPAEFVWGNLTYPNEIQEGEAFELSINVINIGETAGYDAMYIKINGIDTHVMSAQLEPGHGINKTWITFYPYEVGNYSLEMDALEGAAFEGMFTVLEIPEEPIPPFWEQPVWIIVGIAGVGIVAYLYWRWLKTRPVWPPPDFADDLDT